MKQNICLESCARSVKLGDPATQFVFMRRESVRQLIVARGQIQMGSPRCRMCGFHCRNALFAGTAIEINSITFHKPPPDGSFDEPNLISLIISGLCWLSLT